MRARGGSRFAAGIVLGCAAWLAAHQAHADKKDLADIRFDAFLGRASMASQGDKFGGEHGTYTGWYGGMMLESWLAARPTLHGAVGAHIGFEMLIAMPGMVQRDDEAFADVAETPRLWLLGLEVNAGPAWGVYRRGRRSLTVGVDGFYGTERRGFALHGRATLGRVVVAGALRHGATWQGATVFEQALRLGWRKVREVDGKRLERGFGLQFTHGYAEDELGRADLRAFFKGGYTSVAFYGAFGGGM